WARSELPTLENPSLDRRLLNPCATFGNALGIALFDSLPPPPVACAVPDDRQQPSRQLRLVDRFEVLMQREEGLGCQILSHFSATCDAQGEPKHRLDVLVIQLLEG